MIAPNYPPEKQKSAMPKRPNVIGVLADQLRAQALSCNGETNICTPNICLLYTSAEWKRDEENALHLHYTLPDGVAYANEEV